MPVLGYCIHHDMLISSSNCRVHDDGSTCETCQHLFSEFKNPVTVEEYARMRNISPTTVRRKIREEKVKAIKVTISAGNHPKYAYERYIIECEK